MRSPPIGICTTGRSLSGIDTNRGESGRVSSVKAILWIEATSAGLGAGSASTPG